MLVRFHGVRGSTPTCDLSTWRYGGNTPSVEVETPGGHRIIMDGGTGLRSLGRWLPLNGVPGPFRATFLLSHYHWDHIQGLPFFRPLYDPRNRFEFFGPEPEGGATMESALQGQMIRPYFPVELSALTAARAFTAVGPGDRWEIGDASVTAVQLHHPQRCLGFRIETATAVVAYASDTEPGDPAGDRAVRHLARSADLLIYDAQYAPAALDQRRGWGHSSWLEAVAVAKDAGVRHLVLFHHDPESSDATLDRFVRLAREQWPQTWAAAEGLEISCRKSDVLVKATTPRTAPRVAARLPVRLRGRRADGSPLDHEAILANVSVKGIFLVVPELPVLNSEVDIVPLDPVDGTEALTGQVVRIEVDRETGQPAIAVVFPVESWRPRLVTDPGQPPGDASGTEAGPAGTG